MTKFRTHHSRVSVRISSRGLAVVLAALANVGIVFGVGALDIVPAFRALIIPPVAFLLALRAGEAKVVYRRTERRRSPYSSPG